MNINKPVKTITTLVALGAIIAMDARPHRRHHHDRPRVRFGFEFGQPIYHYRPVAYQPFYAPTLGYTYYAPAPVVYEVETRPLFGFSFGNSGTSFGFSI